MSAPVSPEQAFALAIEENPGEPGPRVALARLLAGRGQFAAAKRALEGVAPAPETAALREAIARGTGGQPLGRPSPTRLRGPGWLSVSWRFALVLAVAVGVLAAPLWVPEVERHWRRHASLATLRHPGASVDEKIRAGWLLARLSSGDAELLATGEAVAAALSPVDLPEAEAVRVLVLDEQIAIDGVNAAWGVAPPALTASVAKALGHPSAYVRGAAAEQIASQRVELAWVCANMRSELVNAIQEDEDVAAKLMGIVARSGDPVLRELLLATADEPRRPRARRAALHEIASDPLSFGQRGPKCLREALAADPGLRAALGRTGELVYPGELDAYFARLTSPASPGRGRWSARGEAPKLALFTLEELDAAYADTTDPLARAVIGEARLLVADLRRPRRP